MSINLQARYTVSHVPPFCTPSDPIGWLDYGESASNHDEAEAEVVEIPVPPKPVPELIDLTSDDEGTGPITLAPPVADETTVKLDFNTVLFEEESLMW